MEHALNRFLKLYGDGAETKAQQSTTGVNLALRKALRQYAAEERLKFAVSD